MDGQRRALVTGGAGFIGSHVAEALLAAGFVVDALDNLSSGSRANLPAGCTLIEGDVRTPSDIARAFGRCPEVVLHIAGQASIRQSFAAPEHDLAVNVLGTLNVLAACREHGVRRLLFASSMTVYGNPSVVPTPEDEPPAPVSNYGVTKFAAERYVQIAGVAGDPPIAVTSLRMFNVYGPRQRLDNPYQGVLAIFLGNALRGEPIAIHSDGEQTRDFVFVGDVARAWVAAVNQPRSVGQVLNLGSGRPTSVNALLELVLGSCGLDPRTYPIAHGPAQPGDIRASAADISRAREILKWEPRVRLEDGMAATAAWARAG